MVDPALENEVKVTSEEPYVMSGDQTYFIEDKELNNGYKMPVLGLGTYALTVEEAKNSVYHALKDGYRLIQILEMREAHLKIPWRVSALIM